jgi:predicted ATPase
MSLALNRLGEREGEALVQKLAGNTALTADIVAEIVERTDGVPLFVEELTKAVLESAAQGDRVVAVLGTTSPAALAVPATLHASLMARLDRLGPAAKEIAQIGAVLGREFAYELIEPVAQRHERELKAALGQLGEAGLLFCRGTAPHASYLFKHALVQDAAYSTLLRGRRQELHARVAAALEEHFADLVERQPELLAHHMTAAGNTERAVDQWLKAGQLAAARSAYVEAVSHFNRGLLLLGSQPQTAERDRLEIALQLAKGVSLINARGFSSAEAAEAHARARDLCEKAGDADHLFVAIWGLWNFRRTSDLDAAGDLSDRLLTLVEKNDDVGLRLEAHHTGWTTHFFRGEPAPAQEHCKKGRGLYDFEQHRLHAQIYGHDPGVCARTVGAWSEWLLGHPDKALARINDALALADRLTHPFSLAMARVHASILHQFRRDSEMVLQCIGSAEALAAEKRLALPLDPRVPRGWALLVPDGIAAAVASFRAALADRQKHGTTHYGPYSLTLFAEVLTRSGDHDGALAALADADAIAEEGGERWWKAELHRLTGTVLLAQNKLDEGQASLQQAIRIARAQQAKSLELRAARDLARLWGEQGRRAEARDLLAPVYGWFTEGFDTPDLKEAKALLDELT